MFYFEGLSHSMLLCCRTSCFKKKKEKKERKEVVMTYDAQKCNLYC